MSPIELLDILEIQHYNPQFYEVLKELRAAFYAACDYDFESCKEHIKKADELYVLRGHDRLESERYNHIAERCYSAWCAGIRICNGRFEYYCQRKGIPYDEGMLPSVCVE